ncbi:ABC transporter permease [Ruminiclostridium cellobioparum]|uniref:ABC-type polysaccharide transport system, permease component n=1 Tax=Ruminiclostridium cellobioparum subsp. termitidis CT1112 TaxID=1195236 RepID=S0FLQ4_RUMCE|nr:ABC transporter permease subunit [Ruminiclostridium cellobioparum]EMS69398.1 ABC-type polysaccharide transport system, permease component [Ruminiclostridium cellobioparum subsp. termitidis CT1112]
MKLIRDVFQDFKKNKVILFMLIPAVLYYFIFMYVPMAGIVIAFKRLDYAAGIFGSDWVGLDNFKFFFMSGQAFNVTKNTFLYNLVFIVVNTSLQITVSIFLSEMRNKYVKKTTQTLMLMPYFISWVVVGAFIYNIFNYEFGALNTVLKSLGLQSVDVMGTVGAWKYILVFFNAWNGVGYGSIVYMAAITGIDKELYEASELDGANIFQQIWRITIPSIKPTIIIMILLNVGSIFRGNFSMFYQIIGNNGLLFNSTDVIDTFVFRSLMKTQEVGMASAAGLYQSVLCFAIIMITNGIIKRVDSEYALF